MDLLSLALVCLQVGCRWWRAICTRRATQRHIAAYISSTRQDATRSISRTRNDSSIVYNRLELGLHADTIVLGKNCVVLAHTGRECDVSPYTSTYKAITNVPIVTGATAWTCQNTGDTYILVFHEALWMGDVIDHTLVNPNQLRYFGVKVQDNPYHVVPMHTATEAEDTMCFPLHSEGTTIFLSTRTPTEQELHECVHIELTSKAPQDPHAVQFPEPPRRVEEGLLSDGFSTDRTIIATRRSNDALHGAECFCDTVCPCPQQIVERLIAAVRVPEVLNDVPSRRTFVSNERHRSVTPEELSETWCIGLEQARNTVKITTQKGTRSAIRPLSRRYRADRVFERPLLRGHFYSDTMDGRHKSLDGNKYAQIFANKDFFGVAYPMEAKSGAGDALRQFVYDYGRPEKLTTDDSREQTGKKAEFMSNVQKYTIDPTVTEPDRPNHNFAEGVIRELRKKWFRMMVKQNVPRRLWDYGLRWVCDLY